jgi:hypothetical protein
MIHDDVANFNRTLDEKPRTFIKDKFIFWLERVLRKDSVETISRREHQGAWREDELIGGKPQFVM